MSEILSERSLSAMPWCEQGKQEEMKAKQQAEMKRKAEEHQRTPPGPLHPSGLRMVVGG